MTDEVAQHLVETGKWHIDTARLSQRANHKCEYCDLDFFASVKNYKSFQVDHIIPVSKGGSNSDENKAVSCKTCNMDLKSRWDPTSVCNSKDRMELIKAVRGYISEREAFYLNEIVQMKNIVMGHVK